MQDHLDVDNPSPAPPQSGVKHYAMAMQFCLSVCRFVCRLKLMTAGGGGLIALANQADMVFSRLESLGLGLEH